MITKFKNREIDWDQPVEVYRNLQKKGKCYSVRQGGVVVAHLRPKGEDYLMIYDLECTVSPSGKARAQKTGQRNVHAFIRGKITEPQREPARMWMSAILGKLNYDPFSADSFTVTRVFSSEPPLACSDLHNSYTPEKGFGTCYDAQINEDGITIWENFAP